jgi:4'-phosphopantetheinyl transferase
VHPVDLWTISLTDPRPEILSEEEAARAARFRFDADRVLWIRARSSLRTILAEYAGDAPGSLCFTYGEHGKPALLPVTDIYFNLSHSGDYAMIAIARSAQVGVDIERMRPNIDIAALLRRLGETDLPATVPELYQVWTRREARTKATGGPLFEKPSPDAHAADVKAPEGYAASVALAGFAPVVRYKMVQYKS